MFKKLFSLMMIFMMFSVHAETDVKAGLQSAFDEMNYSLTVEWDQKDKVFYKLQTDKFNIAVKNLQAFGLTQKDMMSFVKSKMAFHGKAHDFETAMNVIELNKMSTEEASSYMMERMKNSYAKGASWNGDVLIYAALGVLLVVASVSLALAGLSGASSSAGGYCRETYVCKTTCYNDYYYGRDCYEDCGYVCY